MDVLLHSSYFSYGAYLGIMAFLDVMAFLLKNMTQTNSFT